MPEYRLCRLDAVPVDDFQQFSAGETEILVVNVSGNLFCLAARCTHAGAPLVEGDLNGEVLTCPWHGSKFRVSDGSVLSGPAEKPLRLYPHTVKGDYLFVELG